MFFIILGGPFAIISEILGAYMRNDKNVTFSVVLQTSCGISNEQARSPQRRDETHGRTTIVEITDYEACGKRQSDDSSGYLFKV